MVLAVTFDDIPHFLNRLGMADLTDQKQIILEDFRINPPDQPHQGLSQGRQATPQNGFRKVREGALASLTKFIGKTLIAIHNSYSA